MKKKKIVYLANYFFSIFITSVCKGKEEYFYMLINEKIYNRLCTFNGENQVKKPLVKNTEIQSDKDENSFLDERDCLSNYNKGDLLLNNKKNDEKSLNIRRYYAIKKLCDKNGKYYKNLPEGTKINYDLAQKKFVMEYPDNSKFIIFDDKCIVADILDEEDKNQDNEFLRNFREWVTPNMMKYYDKKIANRDNLSDDEKFVILVEGMLESMKH